MEQLGAEERKEIVGQLCGDKVNLQLDSENCWEYSQRLPVLID